MWRKREDAKVSPSANVPETHPVSPAVSTSSPAPSAASPSSYTAAQVPVENRGAAASQSAPAPADNFRPRTVENSLQPPHLSIISKALIISGEISGAEDLQIDGELRGSVHLPNSRVLITPEGKVAGNVQAREVIVRGNLKGDVLAGERVLVGATGVWQGDSVSPRLMIEDGALVRGKLEVVKPKPQTQPKKPVAVVETNAASPSHGSNGSGNGSGSANGAAPVAEEHPAELGVVS